MTSSPSPISSAISARRSASVPEATPTASMPSRYRERSLSRDATSSPRTNCWDSKTRRSASWMRGSRTRYWAFKSSSGTAMGRILSKEKPPGGEALSDSPLGGSNNNANRRLTLAGGLLGVGLRDVDGRGHVLPVGGGGVGDGHVISGGQLAEGSGLAGHHDLGARRADDGDFFVALVLERLPDHERIAGGVHRDHLAAHMGRVGLAGAGGRGAARENRSARQNEQGDQQNHCGSLHG